MVVIRPLGTLAELESLWRSLTSATPHSFFLSWAWIRTWLACLPARVQPQLMLVYDDGPVIAAALLVKRTLRRAGVLPIRAWVLNATGDPNLDQIFIEHNGLLTLPGASPQAWRSWAECFISEHDDWDEVQLRGIPPAMLSAWDHPTTSVREDMSLVGRYVDLNEARGSGVSFSATLSKGKRAGIRYTRQACEKFGPLVTEVAHDKEGAMAFFKELKELHQLRWSGRKGGGGAFNYPFFERFHSSLISEHFAEGVIQLLRVRAGDRTVGVLYNFVHQQTVLVYQTGFNYALIKSANKESPGLLTHVLAVDYNVSQGHARYDLLAGDSEYKQTLASKSESLWWGRIQRRRLKFRAEDGGRYLWKRIRKSAGLRK